MMVRRSVLLILCCGLFPLWVEASDPWASLQHRFDQPEQKSASLLEAKQQPVTESDPWQQLQQIFLTFSEQQELEALTNNEIRNQVRGELHKALNSYQSLIDECSHRFQIPREIIAAVIMVESGGNRFAAAPSSSAKGLMQTIDATFKQARLGLQKQGTTIEDDPFVARSSIMAGSWYLNQMFQQTVRDGKQVGQRRSLSAWKSAAEYYYAGPGHGRKWSDVVIIYSGGKRVVIDKPLYSKKVLRWAEILRSA